MNKINFSNSKFSIGIKQLWLDLQPHRLKALLALACTITTIWIGYAYANQGGILGWQFWTWLACVVFIISIFYTRSSAPSKFDLLIMLGLLASALLIRVPFLGSIPGLFHIDEAGVAGFARDNLFGDPFFIMNPFITGPSSQPALHHYILYYSMKIFGFTVAGLRVSSAIAGAMGVVVTYLMVKSISGRRIAILSAIMMAAYHFSIHYSRVGLNNIWDTLWVPLVVYGFGKGWKERWTGGAVLSGFALGISQYFYLGSKIGIFLLILLVITRWKENGNTSQKIGFLGIIGLVALCVAGPIILFAITNPTTYLDRTNQVWGWKPEALLAIIGVVDYWKFFWHQVLYSLGTYTIYPDPSGFYGPTIPLVFGPAAILFIAGIVIAIIRKNWIPLTWLLLTSFFGGFLIGVANGSPHYVVAIPAICWLIGLAIDWIWKSGYAKIAVFLLVALVVIDLYFYFVVYVGMPPRDFTIPFPPPFN
jgi:4-amino-4-deoxy-L-arabinose transferase-like glycosyltransferase